MQIIPPTNDINNNVFSQKLQPSVLHPTRITERTSTCIDNIFVNTVIDTNILSLTSSRVP